MIRGVVNKFREAVVRLRLRGPDGFESDVDAVVDTGFTASLTLPVSMAAMFGLVRRSGGRAVLADGTVREYDTYDIEIEWNGAWRPIVVSGLGRDVLIGMQMLAGHRLCVDAVPGGAVEITPLP